MYTYTVEYDSILSTVLYIIRCDELSFVLRQDVVVMNIII